MALSILIAEEDEVFRRCMVRFLEDHRVVEAATGAAAMEQLQCGPFPIVVAGMEIGSSRERTFLEGVRSLDADALVIVTVDAARPGDAPRALRLGAHDVLLKPCHEEMVAAALRRAVRQVTLFRENQALLDSLKRNVEALGLQNQKLEQLATRDGLTGLHNHRYFRESLETELSRCRRYGRVLSIVFADIDHFKRYNDSHGHLAGDKLLSCLGSLIARNSRKSITVARYGGEEFILLLPEADAKAARRYAENIRTLVESHGFEECEQLKGSRITLSMGVATFPADGTEADALIKSADDALYRAKESGRNVVCV